jgi:tetratricopeptide (TPR) repeat protein
VEINWRAKKWIGFALLSVLVVLIYSNSFQASWHFDDYVNIHKNPRITIDNLAPATVYQTFFASRDQGLYLGQKMYRPVVCLTLALNWYFGQEKVFGYHLVNTAIHVLAAFFLFLTILQLLNTPGLKGKYAQSHYFIALLTATLWAVNPIQVQAVTYIVQRMAAMAAMFYILSIYFYLRGRLSQDRKQQALLYLCCGGTFLLAIGSKENALTLPLALIVIEMIFFQDLSQPQTRRKWLWGFLIGGTCLAAAVFVLAYLGKFDSIFSMYNARYFTIWERLMTQPRILVFYLSQIFYPIPSRLSITHDIAISTSLLQPWTTLPSIMLVLLLIAAGILTIRKSPIVSLAILFYFLGHLIESSVVPLELVFEHRNYLPSIFLFLPVSVGLKMLFDRYGQQKRPMYLVLVYSAVLLIIGLGMGTYIRNLSWATEKTLWEDALAKAPGMARPYQNLAWGFYEKQKQYDKALELYHRALALKDTNPTYAEILSLTNAAGVYYKMKAYDKAIELSRQALEIRPKYIASLRVLTYANIQDGRWDDAVISARRLHKAHPGNMKAMFMYGFCLLKVGNYEEALVHLKKLVRYQPYNHKYYYNIGVALSRLQKYQRADWFLNRAVQLAPNDIFASFYLIENSLNAGDRVGAERYLDRLFQNHSVKDITAYATGLPEDLLKISFTPSLMAPVLAEKLKEKTQELRQIQGSLHRERTMADGQSG